LDDARVEPLEEVLDKQELKMVPKWASQRDESRGSGKDV
jgi:hypothetical protein